MEFKEFAVDALRLKPLAHETVDRLSNGLMAQVRKVAITSAVRILKTVGLCGEVKDSFGTTTPKKAVLDERAEEELRIYMALRPDSFCECRLRTIWKSWPVRMLRNWYEIC